MIACALLPDVWVEATATDQHLCEGIILHLQAVSDRIELDSTRDKTTALLVDLGNLKSAAALHLGECIVQIIQEKVRQPVCVGLAVGKFPALVAASTGERGSVNHVEHAANFLAPVGIGYLPASAETLRRLALLGIHTLGQLAALPSAAVFEQFGREGQRLQRLAQGRDERPILPYRLRQTLTRSRQFEPPVEEGLVLQRVLHAVTDDLSTTLHTEGKTARGLALTVVLADGKRVEQYRLLHDAPLALAVESLFQQLVPDISCAVAGMTLDVLDLTPALPRQLELFSLVASETRRFETRVTELVARYGAERFYRGVVIDHADLLLERRCRWETVG